MRTTRDMGSIPGSGRLPGVQNGNLLQYFCLGNLMDRGAWRATVHGVAKELDMTEYLGRGGVKTGLNFRGKWVNGARELAFIENED